MKTKLFDLGLYKEALRQLKVIGIISGIIMVLNGLLAMVFCWIEYLETLERLNSSSHYEELTFGIYEASYVEYQFMVYPFMLIFVPLMVFSLFAFMNKRNKSDFYHSLPHTRECLAISYLAAVGTWITIIIVLSGLISSISMATVPDVEVLWSHALIQMFNFICGCILAAAIAWLAMTLTGTLFNNVIVSAMLVVIPCVISIITCLWIESEVPYVPFEGVSPFVTGAYNMVFGFVSSYFLDYNMDYYLETIATVVPGLFTLVLAVVLLIAALVLFKKRKSEMAGNSAFNRYVQAGLRISATMMVCLIPTTVLLFMFADGFYEYYSMEEIFLLAVLYILAIFFYYMYELITTRKVSNLKKITKGLFLVVALNVLWIGGQLGVKMYYTNYCPPESSIRYVQVYEEGNAYNQMLLENIKFNSDEMIKIAHDSLENTIELWKNRHNDDEYPVPEYLSDAYSYYEKDYVADTNYYSMSYTVDICMQTWFGPVYRTVKMSNDDYQVFIAELEKTATFQEAYSELPEIKYISDLYVDSWSSYVELTKSQLTELYEIYCEEFAELDFEEAYRILNDSHSYELGVLRVGIEMKDDYYSLPLTINLQFTKTLNALAEMTNQKVETACAKEGADNIFDLIDEKLNDCNLSITVLEPDKEEHILYRYYYDSYKEQEMSFIEMLSEQMKVVPDETIRKDSNILIVSFYSHEDGTEYAAYYAVDNAFLETFKQDCPSILDIYNVAL